MHLSKRKKYKIAVLSFLTTALENQQLHTRLIEGEPWYNCQPEMWADDERALWEMLDQVERELKTGIIKIVQGMDGLED